ncbi:MAG: NAD(P)H-quinone oxidoreductase [Acidobacteria bacterium]|nr:NAD(P)H-quinone oxidoreductase [Acidobacteriota bacterium]
MKAVVIAQHGSVEGLSYRDAPDPECGSNELLVRVRATALNRADILQRRGLYPPPEPRTALEIPGLEFAGEIEVMGPCVSGFRLGERVMGITSAGGHAEKLAVPGDMAMHVPDILDWHQAASIPEVFITAHDALVTQCKLGIGNSVLIHAAGSGVGIAAIQVAKYIGACPIFGTAGSNSKLARARELGVDIGINYHTEDFAEVVDKITQGHGVDVIVDVVGAAYWDRNIRALAHKGQMILVGLLSGTSAQVNLSTLIMKRLKICGTALRVRPLDEKVAATRAFEKFALPLLQSGRMKPVIDRVFHISEIREAHLFMESNTNFGKIVLDVS